MSRRYYDVSVCFLYTANSLFSFGVLWDPGNCWLFISSSMVNFILICCLPNSVKVYSMFIFFWSQIVRMPSTCLQHPIIWCLIRIWYICFCSVCLIYVSANIADVGWVSYFGPGAINAVFEQFIHQASPRSYGTSPSPHPSHSLHWDEATQVLIAPQC
jgi:hypothetical protein